MSEHLEPPKAYWATRRRSARPADPAATGPNRPRFPRFDAAMAAARVAKAPHLALYGPALPAAGHPPWRASGRPVARWLGIGGCVLLLGLLLIIILTQPIGAAPGG